MTRVRGHWRRVVGGWTWVRPHNRGRPRPRAAVGGGLGIVVLLIGVAIWWTSSSEPVAHSVPEGQVTVTRGPLSPQHAELVQVLRADRQRMDLSLQEAGERARMSAGEIGNLENGVVVPTYQDIGTLSRVYQLSREEWTNLVIIRNSLD